MQRSERYSSSSESDSESDRRHRRSGERRGDRRGHSRVNHHKWRSPSPHRHRQRDRSRSKHKYEDSRYSKGKEDHKRKIDDEKYRMETKRRQEETRSKEKLSVLAKLGIELKLPENDNKKKLWSKSKTNPGTTWNAANFSDDKVTAKFQRLMGMKQTSENTPCASTNSLSGNQEELFKRMEEDYEVARQATHTLRGAGLGFK